MTRTILLADDSITIQKVIELTFTEEDYRIVAVGDGDAALGRLGEVGPDLVIADVNMPGADGYEVAREVKERLPAVPVLLLVGTFEPFDEDRARASGADETLKKPFDSQELQRVVERLLAGAGEAGDREAPQAPAAADAQPEPAAEREPAAAGFALPGPAAGEEPEPPVERAGSAHPAPESPEEVAWAEPPAPPAPSEDAGAAGDAEADRERPGAERDATPSDASAGAEDEDAPFGELAEPPRGVGATEADPEIFEVAPESFRGTAPGAEPHLPEESFAREGATGYRPPEEGAGDRAADAGEEARPAEGVGLPPAEAEASGGEPGMAAPDEPAPGEEAGATASAGPGEAATAPDAPDAAGAPAAAGLSEDDVDRIARRVVELLADQSVREVAWEVVPDVAEIVIKDRLRELEAQIQSD